MTRHRFSAVVPALFLGLVLGTGCEVRQGMWDQPKYEPLEASEFLLAEGFKPPRNITEHHKPQ